MVLPNSISSIKTKDNELKGIIYQIINKYNIANPLTNNIIELNSSITQNGDRNTVVLWNQYWQTFLKKPNEVFIQMKFPGRYLFPSGYSMKGTEIGRHYAKKWSLQGFNEGDENNRNNWELLNENTAAEGGYCKNVEVCVTGDVASYSVSQRTKGYRYLRWTSIESSTSNGDIHFATSEIEIYGVLSSNKSFFKCIFTRKSFHHSTYSMSMLLMISFLVT